MLLSPEAPHDQNHDIIRLFIASMLRLHLIHHANTMLVAGIPSLSPVPFHVEDWTWPMGPARNDLTILVHVASRKHDVFGGNGLETGSNQAVWQFGGWVNLCLVTQFGYDTVVL